jgi:hypothetical protein
MYCHNSSPRTMKSISNQNSQKLTIVSTNLSRQKPNTSHPSAHARPFHSQTWQNGRIHVTTLRATGCLRRSPTPQPKRTRARRRRLPLCFPSLTFSPSSSPSLPSISGDRAREQRGKHVVAVGSRAPGGRAGRRGRDRGRRRGPGAEAPDDLVRRGRRRRRRPPRAAAPAPRLPDSEQGPLPLPILIHSVVSARGCLLVAELTLPAMCLCLCRPVRRLHEKLGSACDRIRTNSHCSVLLS